MLKAKAVVDLLTESCVGTAVADYSGANFKMSLAYRATAR